MTLKQQAALDSYTKSQRRVLRQAHKGDGTRSCTRAVANQLVKRGLALIADGTHDRREWGRVVASLPVIVLTDRGHRVAAQLIAALSTSGPGDRQTGDSPATFATQKARHSTNEGDIQGKAL
jgi:hypothetical protein